VKKHPFQVRGSAPLIQAASCAALLVASAQVGASEGYKLRQAPIGAFGGEIASQVDNPGFFGTVAYSHATIDRIADGNNEDLNVAGRTVPLPTGAPTGGQVPNGTYSLVVPAAAIAFHQTQSQVNLLVGYMTDETYAGGRVALAVNIPFVKQSRTFVPGQAVGVIAPTPPPITPAALRAALTTIGNAAAAQVQAGVAAVAAQQNADVSGIGDTEFSAVWIKREKQLRIAAGVSLYAPTGVYNKDRGPNPGFGNFYTLRPGVAVSYSLNPHVATGTDWDAGITVAGRISYGINSVNKDTDYRTGNFVYTEGAITKVTGNFAIGANLLMIRQLTDDTGPNVGPDGMRYRNVGYGPFISYKLPGKDAGFNLQYATNAGSRNALVAKTLQLRFIQAW
jgi:hypothetical protein